MDIKTRKYNFLKILRILKLPNMGKYYDEKNYELNKLCLFDKNSPLEIQNINILGEGGYGFIHVLTINNIEIPIVVKHEYVHVINNRWLFMPIILIKKYINKLILVHEYPFFLLTFALEICKNCTNTKPIIYYMTENKPCLINTKIPIYYKENPIKPDYYMGLVNKKKSGCCVYLLEKAINDIYINLDMSFSTSIGPYHDLLFISCLFQILFSLLIIHNSSYRISHGDVYSRNIFYIKDEKFTASKYMFLEYIYKGKSYMVPYFGYLFLLEDFSFLSNINNPKKSYWFNTGRIINTENEKLIDVVFMEKLFTRFLSYNKHLYNKLEQIYKLNLTLEDIKMAFVGDFKYLSPIKENINDYLTDIYFYNESNGHKIINKFNKDGNLFDRLENNHLYPSTLIQKDIEELLHSFMVIIIKYNLLDTLTLNCLFYATILEGNLKFYRYLINFNPAFYDIINIIDMIYINYVKIKIKGLFPTNDFLNNIYKKISINHV